MIATMVDELAAQFERPGHHTILLDGNTALLAPDLKLRVSRLLHINYALIWETE